MTEPTDSITAAQEAHDRGVAARQTGDAKGVLAGFLMALAIAPENPIYRRDALNILGVTSGYKTLPAPILDALRQCASDTTLDLQPLSLVIKNLFESDERFRTLEQDLAGPADEIEQNIQSGMWDWFLSEPLLHAVLARAIVIGVRLERVLTLIRRHFLMHTSTALLVRHERFVTSLALQANRARFPWAESAEEQDQLQKLDRNAAFIRAPYRPLIQLSDNAALSLPDVLRAARTIQLEIRESAKQLVALTLITDSISARVKDQYERFPYPPWDAIDEIAATTLDEFVATRFPTLAWATTPSPKVLSAGCGTGRGAVMLGLTFPDAKITAIDLSRTSLAYARMKAEQHGLQNITLGVGDILNISALNTAFDLIESSGVLHHMAEPWSGLRALAATLKPGGLMRVALYSERGRSAVAAARALIAAHDIPDTDNGVRQARQILQALPADHPARGVIDTPEFFTLDGLHDLIFNVQETRYTPRGLKALLETAELKFLGFDVSDNKVKEQYRRENPDDLAMLDLDKWDAFEHNHPGTFAEMYHLWCHKA